MVVICAHIVDLKYVIEDQVVIQLICRTAEGKLITIRDYYQPYFYLLPKQYADRLELRARLARLAFDDKNKVTRTEEVTKRMNAETHPLIKVYTSRPETISKVVETTAAWEDIITYFENDISLTRKYLLEKGLTPFSIFEAEVTEHDNQYKLVHFRKKDITFAEPVIMAVSVAGEEAITSLSCTTTGKTVTITWKKVMHDVRHVNSEQELIDAFRKLLIDVKPDILVFESSAWGLSAILERAKRYRIHFTCCDGSDPYINTITGRVRTVGMNEVFMDRIIRNFVSFELEDTELEQSFDLVTGMINITTSGEDEHAAAVSLTHKKAILNYRMFQSLFTSLTELFKLLGLRAADLLNFRLNTIVEWVFIRHCIQQGHIVMNKHHDEQASPALQRYQPVIDPLPGIYTHIALLDLTPIYPKIITEYNISPDTDTAMANDRKGILPVILEDINVRAERIELAMQKTSSPHLHRRRKILLKIYHQVYEYLHNQNARLYSPALLQRINAQAKSTINAIIKTINEQSSVIDSDYAEIYIALRENATDVCKRIRLAHPVAAHLAVIETFECGMFLPRDERGRRFALLNDGELVYHNTTRQTLAPYSISAAENLMRSILSEDRETTLKKARTYVKQLSTGNVPLEKMIITTKLTRELDEYTEKTIAYHIIKELKRQGNEVHRGDSISYVIVPGEEAVSKRARLPETATKYDIHYYLERQLLPTIEDMLILKGITFEDVLHEDEHDTNLREFMQKEENMQEEESMREYEK